MTASGIRETARILGRGSLALVLILCCGELLVRLLIGGPSPQVYDPEIGYAYLPHSEQFQATEGYARLRFNALGLNDSEVAPRDGQCRVLVIGDSYTAALQVPRESNFTSVAEQLDRRLDVVNAGRDGLFLGDMHKVFNRLAKGLKPDLVVYVLSQRAIEGDIQLPEFTLSLDPGTGAIRDAVMRVEEKESLKRIIAPLLGESALATRLAAQLKPAVTDALKQFTAWRDALKPGRAAGAPAAGAPAAGPAVARPSSEDVLTFLFRRFSAGTPTALLYLNALQYQPEGRATAAPLSNNAEALARRAAARAEIRLFNTAGYLTDAMAQSRQPPYGFNNALRPGGHLNDEGHRAVGRALVDLVREMGPALPRECAAK